MAKLIGYVGSKEKLLSVIGKYIPKTTKILYEPFCGSASVSLSQEVSDYYLADSQPELINFLECIKDNPILLIERIRELVEVPQTEELYLSLRAQDRREGFLQSSKFSRAARYYYLVNTGYNNLYRVNGKGFCNTPYAKGLKKVPENWQVRIMEKHQHMTTYCKGIFEQQFDDIEVLTAILDSQEDPKDIFIFLDPPYFGTFDQYTKERTSELFWIRLKNYLEVLDKAGISFLMTNSYHDFILETFGKWNIEQVPVKYTVAADKSKRVLKSEAFITNIKLQGNQSCF